MDRVWESNPSSTPPSAPSTPLTGYPAEGGTPTVPGAWWFYMITEEIRAALVQMGITPSATTANQLAAALALLAPLASPTFTGTVTAPVFNVTSDRRLKKGIRAITGALEKLDLFHGSLFRWRAGNEKAAGLIAQDFARAVPEGVRKGNDGLLKIDPMAAIAFLTEALREERNARLLLEQRLAKIEAR